MDRAGGQESPDDRHVARLDFGAIGGLPSELPDCLSGLLEGRTYADALEPILRHEQRRRRVLIHAAAGGVGTAAIQIGQLLSIETYGTSSSEEKLERVKKLGLDHGINYREVDYEQRIKELTNGEGVDAVFEMLGGDTRPRACAVAGRLGESSFTAPRLDSGTSSTPAP